MPGVDRGAVEAERSLATRTLPVAHEASDDAPEPTVWASREDFVAWTESEAFLKAHSQARAPEGTYLAHPDFEGFDVVL